MVDLDGPLLLARDRLGKKPLYYAALPEGLYFGSELKCLRAASVPLDEDRDGLRLYFQFGCIPDPYSAFRGVRKLKPGGVFASVLAPPSNAAERPDVVVKTMQLKSDPKTLLEMARAVQSGKLSIPLGRSFPLKDASAAHAAAEAGSSGKILLLA